ncbi:hypothetical protein DFH06DRAFT_991494, partial [Mycena polygramma]
SLARLARTCRTFSDSSLDILWRSQESLAPLLRCFPPHVWEITESLGIHRPAFHFRSVPRTQDWDRVLVYASRVQEISVGGGGKEAERLLLQVLEVLTMSSPIAILLPNLRTLAWNAQAPALSTHICLFLAPSLASISLDITAIAIHLPHLPRLSYIASYLPCLTDITIVAPIVDAGFDEEVVEEVAAFVLELKNAQRLSLPALVPTAYQHVASLSGFTDLTVQSLGRCPSPEDLMSNTDSGFAELRRLWVEAATLHLAANLLRWCSETPLESFRLSCSALTPAIVVSDFFATFRRYHDHLTSIDIRLSTSFPAPHDQPQYAVTSSVLRPLLLFRNLQNLQIRSSLDFSLDDEFVEAMSKAWPSITNIRFHVTTRDLGLVGTWGGSITLSGVAALARCPLLYDLEIDVDARVVPDVPQLPSYSPQASLKFLSVGSSPIDSAPSVATFLGTIFAAYPRTEADDDGPTHTKWKEVWTLLLAARPPQRGWTMEELLNL